MEPVALGGTFAVSFFVSGTAGAGAIPDIDGTLAAGGMVADGIVDSEGLGAKGGAPASEAGLAAAGGGGTPTTEGGFGIDTAPGAAKPDGGFGGGGGGAPGTVGGLGATGGDTVGPAAGETPGGFGRGGMGGGATEAGWGEIDPGGF